MLNINLVYIFRQSLDMLGQNYCMLVGVHNDPDGGTKARDNGGVGTTDLTPEAKCAVSTKIR
jgi:hypothetical protein